MPVIATRGAPIPGIVRKIRAVHWRPVCGYPYGMAFGVGTVAELRTYVERLPCDEFRIASGSILASLDGLPLNTDR